MESAANSGANLVFGRFQVSPHRRELLADGQPLSVGGRAFDVLMMLIEARGAVVDKRALIGRAWPTQVVDENTLQAQIFSLRAAFGPESASIDTVSGCGYRFTEGFDKADLKATQALLDAAGKSAWRDGDEAGATSAPAPPGFLNHANRPL